MSEEKAISAPSAPYRCRCPGRHGRVSTPDSTPPFYEHWIAQRPVRIRPGLKACYVPRVPLIDVSKSRRSPLGPMFTRAEVYSKQIPWPKA